MGIQTKYAIGDNLWIVRDSKATSFEVACILIEGNTVLYGATRYDTVIEAQCFATKEELLKYVSDDGK